MSRASDVVFEVLPTDEDGARRCQFCGKLVGRVKGDLLLVHYRQHEYTLQLPVTIRCTPQRHMIQVRGLRTR